MLRYEKGQFSLEGVSFTIPDGWYLDCSPDVIFVNGLELYPPDYACCVDIFLSYDRKSPEEELATLFAPDSQLKLRGEIRPGSCHGLTGCEAWYDSEGECYYEARFEIRQGRRLHHFCLGVASESPLDELLTRPDIAALRSSLRKD